MNCQIYTYLSLKCIKLEGYQEMRMLLTNSTNINKYIMATFSFMSEKQLQSQAFISIQCYQSLVILKIRRSLIFASRRGRYILNM